MTTTAGLAMDPPGGAYPVRLDVAYPENLNRWLVLVKWLLAIPHLIILYALTAVSRAITLVAFFAVLFTAKYPEGLFKFNVGISRWTANVSAYIDLMRDEYPPFSLDAGQYAVTLEIDYPQTIGRFSPLYQWLLAIPHFIVLFVLLVVATIALLVAWFAILFTGNYPRGLFDFVVGVQRWSQRVSAYAAFMTNEYPPFSLK